MVKTPLIYPDTAPGPLNQAVSAAHYRDETACLRDLIDEARLREEEAEPVARLATALVERVRAERRKGGGLDAFLHEYELSTREGVMLMCLAEALLRVPDAETQDRLIRDKIGGQAWEKHIGNSSSLFVNASTWGLMLTGRVVSLAGQEERDWKGMLSALVSRSGEPIIRKAVNQAMRIMGRQFVQGRTIEEAISRSRPRREQGYRFSFDMLGEGARTMADAERYAEAYRTAILALGALPDGRGDIQRRPGISVKLSALHPRYEAGQRERVFAELLPRLRQLALLAKENELGFCIDAEEAGRLELSLELFERLVLDPDLRGWDGFGLAVQAYQKRARAVIDWLAGLGRRASRRLMVRLVKGAYWDTEIKHAQELGLDGYPVFTRKAATDVSYLACARALLAAGDVFFPQFATHNAHTVAAIAAFAGNRRDFEFQRLHGMGGSLYEALFDLEEGHACRIYAPVGSHEDLLAYLVRRLLENGANSSFVNRIFDDSLPVAKIIEDPVRIVERLGLSPHPKIPLPRNLYGEGRLNSKGEDLEDYALTAGLKAALEAAAEESYAAAPLIGGKAEEGTARPIRDPACLDRIVGEVAEADPAQARRAASVAKEAAAAWDRLGGTERAAILRRAADLFEQDRAHLMYLAIREAGKTVGDAVAEIREAVDFLRYYALMAERDFAAPERLPGPTGEDNRLSLHGRGVFVCISPWNFPLAIFTGQVSAALAAGNAVLAKPAEQTPLIATHAVALLHRAGVPETVLHLLPGDGALGAALVSDPAIGGVAFTGSTETAKAIHGALAARPGPILPLIAETGGQNAMIVDSTALPEQVVDDVVRSAFHSAGQRCSALRVLFVQEPVAEKIVRMLEGAMAELRIGDPGLLSTDLGPVIDRDACAMLQAHAERMMREGELLASAPAVQGANGHFITPKAFRIDDLGRLEREVFGPVLHVIPYAGDRLGQVCEAINGTGYGLTLGIHSRIDETVQYILTRVRVGNAYVNRNMIGAVVGVQPFGGEGLSGTGPKAGGPRYLHRFATERVVSVDTTAAGGNAALMTMD